MSYVNDKMPAALLCKTRPLQEGESPKHPGQDYVYEATSGLNEDFRRHLQENVLEASWKVDGTCCLIKNGMLYRRYDTKGKTTNRDMSTWIPGESDGEKSRIWWIPVIGSTKREDQLHLSCLEGTYFWTITFYEGAMVPFLTPIDPTECATYELIGPKFAAKYNLPFGEIEVVLDSKKGTEECILPRHYLVRHGDYAIPDFPYSDLLNTDDPVVFFKDYILRHNVEGLIFRHKTNSSIYYKVNRGHISTPINYKIPMILNPNVQTY